VILLASRSPQRRALLGHLGVDFRVVASNAAEVTEGPDPVSVVEANAAAKAREVANRSGVPAGGAVLGADTEVVLDGLVLGKPADATDARAMLGRLSGRSHTVITGITLITPYGERRAHEVTEVTFRELSVREIDWYLATGEWRDRAGGYAIQAAGGALCAAISGDISNVVGLPIARVAGMLLADGIWPNRTAAESPRNCGRGAHRPRRGGDHRV
jgi:septum formation protein